MRARSRGHRAARSASLTAASVPRGRRHRAVPMDQRTAAAPARPPTVEALRAARGLAACPPPSSAKPYLAASALARGRASGHRTTNETAGHHRCHLSKRWLCYRAIRVGPGASDRPVSRRARPAGQSQLVASLAASRRERLPWPRSSPDRGGGTDGSPLFVGIRIARFPRRSRQRDHERSLLVRGGDRPIQRSTKTTSRTTARQNRARTSGLTG